MSLNVIWGAINLRADPVPGDPAGVRNCADTAKSKYQTVDSLIYDVSLISSDHDNGSVFVGKAADRFVSKLEDFPSNLSSLSDGLCTISQTLNSWADCMEDCQSRALDAYNRALSAQNSVIDTESDLDRARGNAANASKDLLQKSSPRAGVDDADVQRAQQRAKAAQQQVVSFHKKLGKAQNSYDTAKKDISKAGYDYMCGAEIAARGLNGALDDLPPVSVFDRVYYSDTWRTIVKVAETANLVITIAMLLLGPGGILGLLAFALAAIGFANDLLAYAHGDENMRQVALGGLSMILAGVPGVLVKQSAAGLRFFTESKGLPMYQRVIGGLNSYGRNSGMVTDFVTAWRKSNYKLFENTGLLKHHKETAKIVLAVFGKKYKEATRLFNDYQLRGVLPHNWKWLLEKSDLYGVFNPADTATIIRFGLDASRGDLRADAMKNVVKDMIDAEKRVEDHKAEGKTGFVAGLTEWAGLLAPAAPVLGLVGQVADSML